MAEDNMKKNQDSKKQPKAFKPYVIWIILFIIVLYLFQDRNFGQFRVRTPSYSEFYEEVQNGMVRQVELSNNIIKGEYNDRSPFQLHVPENDPELLPMVRRHVKDFTVKPPNTLLGNLLISLIPMLLFIGFLWFFVYRQMRGVGNGAMSFGRSRAKMLEKDREKVTFKDVAGVDEAREEVEEIIEFLTDPQRFQKLGGKIPKGVLLVGPPGTGKTLLAKSIAGEADVPFFTISGSDFVEMFVGVGASRVRDLFEQGKKSAPCIIFIDEIDAVGRHRGTGIGGGHDEREQTLNALLVEMDGFNTSEGVIIMAATNRPDVLDPALLRPGRFDRQIVIDLPDLNGRFEILKVHAKKIKLAKEVDLKVVARGTPGFSGADLANLVNESALLAARNNKEAVSLIELEEGRDKVRWGRERKSRVMSPEDRKITAYHEAGHAVVLYKIPETEPLHKVTIIPRGVAYLGATMQLPEKDKYHETKSQLLGQVAGLMGGRIAEEMTFGDVTSGASNDIEVATKIARKMVCDWGMSDKVGPVNYSQSEEHIFLGKEIGKSKTFSEETAQMIEVEIKKIVQGGYDRARKILTENHEALKNLAEALLKEETIDGKQAEDIIDGKIHVVPDVKAMDLPNDSLKNDPQVSDENSSENTAI